MAQTELGVVLGLSALAQASAAWIALRQIGAVSGRYRFMWGFVALALALMVERRAVPLWRLVAAGDPGHAADAWFGLAISLLMVTGIYGIRQLFIDMKQQEVQLDALARTDALTGLPNRREILERLQTEIERCARARHPMAILMFDIDHFKQVNDLWGHAAGDRVLKAVADTAHASLRRIDSCGRVGGEEFLVLLPETSHAEAQAAAERLRAAIADRSIENEGPPLRVTASIGVAIHQADAPQFDAGQLVQRADRALYAAKAAGRDCVVMDAS